MALSESSFTEAELNYAKSASAFDLLVTSEQSRRLRSTTVLLEGRIDSLNHKALEESDCVEAAEEDADACRTRAQELEVDLERTLLELRSKVREVDLLKTELSSLHDASADSAKVFTDKLALTREVAVLRPEVEHLRSQVSLNEGLLAEKLSAEQRLLDLQAELNTEKQLHKKAAARRESNEKRDAAHMSQVETLEKELRDAQRQLAARKDEALNDEKEQLVDLRRQLSKEKKDREAADTRIAKAESRWEAQKSVLEDKLEQFRTKLRSTKEKLRDTEDALQKAELGPTQRIPTKDRGQKNVMKRSRTTIEADSVVGTPGDAVQNKRAKRASSVVGDKSTFSITPFLNRTASIAPESPAAAGEDEAMASIETAEASPSARSRQSNPGKSSKETKSRPVLASASVGRSNTKTTSLSRRKAAKSSLTLENVAEEDVHGAENRRQELLDTDALPEKAEAVKPQPRPASGLLTLRAGSLPPTQPKKSRKLLGGGGQTLFDINEDAEPADLGSYRAGGPQRTFGGFGGRGFGGLKALGAKKKGPLMVTSDGFAFSPLKKDRKAAASLND
ncbi:MAG: hypothetical protein M1828_003232 [Chrysothrix sp. TS-e1954]|nr:MAG: hypothetical protein M1828_003232 [Chrysothrix sp. TS-e1954]